MAAGKSLDRRRASDWRRYGASQARPNKPRGRHSKIAIVIA